MADQREITKRYSNGEVTIVWKPHLCIHSGNCVRGLPEVFDNKARPWINPEGAPTQDMVNQVKKCPSGALSYILEDESAEGEEEIESERIVEVLENGPLMVYGNVRVKDAGGKETSRHRVTAFCRCGGSSNKPFCDGTHKKNGFRG